MIGSLNKVWPWKHTLETYIDTHGVEQVLGETNVSPGKFAGITGSDPLVWQAIVMCIAGILLIWGIEYIGKKLGQENEK